MADKLQSFFLPVSVEILVTMERKAKVQGLLPLPAQVALGAAELAGAPGACSDVGCFYAVSVGPVLGSAR